MPVRKTKSEMLISKKYFLTLLEDIESNDNLAIIQELYPKGFSITLKVFQNLLDHGYTPQLRWPITGCVKQPDGTKQWHKYGLLHRIAAPAIIHSNGFQQWYQNNKLHRLKGPAVIHPDGTQEWWYEGKRHRENNPAIIHPHGAYCWYIDDQLHRENGPAVVNSDGYQAWYKNGKLHRENGPALTLPSGDQLWFLNNTQVNPHEHNPHLPRS